MLIETVTSEPVTNDQFWSESPLSHLKIGYFLSLCYLLFGVGLAGCGNSAPVGIGGLNFLMPGEHLTKINEIKPKQNAATITLQGQVVTRAPFLGSGAYKLEDATGTIWVITNQSLPNVGDEVLLKGEPQFQSIPVGGKDIGEVYVQEQQQLQRKAGQPASSKGHSSS